MVKKLTIPEGLKPYLVHDGRKNPNSEYSVFQYIFEFDNGYCVSVIRAPYSYGVNKGLWELAVVPKGDDYSMLATAHVTDDVIGYLSSENAIGLVMQIKNMEVKH